jgi:uncharacterized protein YukE
MSAEILVPVSFGELLDKISILQIKSERISDEGKLANVRRELSALEQTWMAHPAAVKDIAKLRAELKAVNEQLWDIEDDIRLKERRRRSTRASSTWRAASTCATTSVRASRRRSTWRWARRTWKRSPTRITRSARNPGDAAAHPRWSAT